MADALNVFQYEDLEDSMTDALINDKPQFVRLFCENGLNILDYLTYQRLEGLYRSLADSLLAYVLLQRRLGERQGLAGSLPNLDGGVKVTLTNQSELTGPTSAKELSLYEVRKRRMDSHRVYPSSTLTNLCCSRCPACSGTCWVTSVSPSTTDLWAWTTAPAPDGL